MSTLTSVIEGKQLSPVIKPAPTKIVNISLEIGRSQKVTKALASMTNEEKAEFLIQLIRTVGNADSEGLGELTEIFGEEFASHPVLQSCRKIYTLDRQKYVFRCWYGAFGSVTNHGNFTHFDSCGKGLFFHAQCDDVNTLERFSRLFTDRMVEWKSEHGTMWVGFK